MSGLSTCAYLEKVKINIVSVIFNAYSNITVKLITPAGLLVIFLLHYIDIPSAL